MAPKFAFLRGLHRPGDDDTYVLNWLDFADSIQRKAIVTKSSLASPLKQEAGAKISGYRSRISRF